jgi:folate-binding protein YgfZ
VDLAVTRGYVALRENAAWIDLSTRGKIRMRGDDRARLLHSMTTNHIEQLQPGQGCYAFFLNAQGRILADVNVLCFEDHLLLDTEPETRHKILEHLERYIIADDVTLEDVTEAWATIAVEGPRAAQALGLEIPPYSWVARGSAILARLSSTGGDGFFVFTPIAEKLQLDLPEATADDARTVRIEHGRPRYGDEITERYLVQETDQLQAVHFSKGCYLGQEIVERVRSLAKIHRVLRRLEIDAQEPPPAGTKTEQAEIVSAAFSPALRKTVAMAYVKIPFAEPGTEFLINQHPARVM